MLDFILAVLKTSSYKPKEIKKSAIELDDDLKNISTRAMLFKTISQKYKLKIQNMIIYPIEIKSNKDETQAETTWETKVAGTSSFVFGSNTNALSSRTVPYRDLW